MDIWVVTIASASTTLIPFSYFLGKRKGYKYGKSDGYVAGSRDVLTEWKKFNEEVGYYDGK